MLFERKEFKESNKANLVGKVLFVADSEYRGALDEARRVELQGDHHALAAVGPVGILEVGFVGISEDGLAVDQNPILWLGGGGMTL